LRSSTAGWVSPFSVRQLLKLTLQPALMRVVAVGAAEDLDEPIAAAAETGDDLGIAIAVEIADAGEDRALDAGVPGPLDTQPSQQLIAMGLIVQHRNPAVAAAAETEHHLVSASPSTSPKAGWSSPPSVSLYVGQGRRSARAAAYALSRFICIRTRKCWQNWRLCVHMSAQGCCAISATVVGDANVAVH
jgi:hypothetical protein